jgi:hypothetical protein
MAPVLTERTNLRVAILKKCETMYLRWNVRGLTSPTSITWLGDIPELRFPALSGRTGHRTIVIFHSTTSGPELFSPVA